MARIIIPSEKNVSKELQCTGELPAILYPVSNDIVLDYMLKQYESRSSKIEIVCYENIEMVKNKVSSYRNDKINIIELDKLDDLGYTIFKAIDTDLEYTDDEIIINFANIIVLDNIYNHQGDCYFYSQDNTPNTTTYFEESIGKIQNIIDDKKGSKSIKHNSKYFIGAFKITKSMDFYECLKVALRANTKTESFYTALQAYSKLHPMRAIKSASWFEIGCADNYYNSMLSVRAREFNHIVIDKERGILRKTSDDNEKLKDEILWYQKLPPDLEYVKPRIYSHGVSEPNIFVEMEYYSYNTVHDLLLRGGLTYKQWMDIFKRIKFIYDDFTRYKISDVKINEALEEMYLNKTLKRLSKLSVDKRFNLFFQHCFSINGVKYKPLSKICDLLDTIIKYTLYDIDEFTIIHGDLCFSNLLIDNNLTFIKVIDPRGSFGKYDIYGDPRYDLAKLLHSVDGKYDFIIKNLFSLKVDLDENHPTINYSISCEQENFFIYECFLNCFQDEIDNLMQLELIESLLFLSMISLHTENIDHQYVMLCRGIQILDRCADIRV